VSSAAAAGVVAVSAIVLAWESSTLYSRDTGRGSGFEGAVRHPRAPSPARPMMLEELDRLVRWRVWTAGDVYFRLRPVLREIAAHRLRRGHGVDLDSSPEAVRRLLGEVAFEILRFDRQPPRDRLAPGGITPADLADIVKRLDAL
jgi:hypothetical protein